MPFKSKAQLEKFKKMEKEGKLPKGTTAEWLKETPNTKNLPDRITPKKDERQNPHKHIIKPVKTNNKR